MAVDTEWWSGGADLLTFQPVELIATKFRALAQRSKGRDLNDLDVAAYLVDPVTAGDPRALVTRWIRWTDQHLDLPFARLSADSAPSKRKQRSIDEISERLARGTSQCPAHDFDGQVRRRCPHQLDDTDGCADHGLVQPA